jgi:hypothetical protein
MRHVLTVELSETRGAHNWTRPDESAATSIHARQNEAEAEAEPETPRLHNPSLSSPPPLTAAASTSTNERTKREVTQWLQAARFWF